ncbi:MAG: hypothetical protein R2799_13515 [Crocinitomicaceae bacterium]
MIIKKITFFVVLIPFFTVAQINQNDASGQKHGKWIGTYPNSTQTAYEGTFDHGKRTGVFFFYYPNGKMKAAMKFSKNGTFARAEMYFEDGTLIAKGNYVNEKKDSVWTYFGGTGYVRKTEGWKNGRLEGKTTVYMEPQPGDTKLKPIQFMTYRDSILNGPFAVYYPSGEIKQKGNYLDGNMDGEVYTFYESGKRMIIERYKYAVRHGLWVYFNEDGTLNRKRYFNMNRELKGKELEEKLQELKSEN